MEKTIHSERLVIIILMTLIIGLVMGLYIAQNARITTEKLQQARGEATSDFGDLLLKNSETTIRIDEATGKEFYSFDVLADCHSRRDDKAERLYCTGTNGYFELDLDARE